MLEAERAEVLVAERAAAAVVAAARRRGAGRPGEEITAHLGSLATPRAVVTVAVDGDDPADEVTFLLAANPGLPAVPLARAASGGELARTMLATRLVLSAGPPILVFDEVDAGIGGQAASHFALGVKSLVRLVPFRLDREPVSIQLHCYLSPHSLANLFLVHLFQ